MILKDGPKSKKNVVFFLKFFKAVKIHLISKGLAMPTNPSTARADTPVLRGEVYMTFLGAYTSRYLQVSIHSSYF